MSKSQSFEHTSRQYRRARDRAKAALATPKDDQFVLQAISPIMVTKAEAFGEAEVAVGEALRNRDRAVAEESASIDALKLLHDQLCVMAENEGGGARLMSSAYSTPDDFFRAAEDLGAALASPNNASWAPTLLARFAPVLARATQARTAATDAKNTLQNATNAREKVARESRPVFVNFRRVVKTTFGESHAAYRELLDRRYGTPAQEEEPEPEPPSDPTPVKPNT